MTSDASPLWAVMDSWTSFSSNADFSFESRPSSSRRFDKGTDGSVIQAEAVDISLSAFTKPNCTAKTMKIDWSFWMAGFSLIFPLADLCVEIP